MMAICVADGNIRIKGNTEFFGQIFFSRIDYSCLLSTNKTIFLILVPGKSRFRTIILLAMNQSIPKRRNFESKFLTPKSMLVTDVENGFCKNNRMWWYKK